MTLRTRIAAAAGLSVALAVLAVAAALYIAVRADLRGEIDSALRARAAQFLMPPGGAPPFAAAGGPPGGGPPAGRRFPGSLQPAPFGAASGFVQILAADGSLSIPRGQGPAPERIGSSAGDREIAAAGRGSRMSEATVGGTHLRVLTLGVSPGVAVMVARPLTEVEHELHRLLLILALVGGAGIVLAALLGAGVARTALAPIARFTRSTETLTGRVDLSRRLEGGGAGDELGRLADSFNATLDALERSVAAQRQLIADAGHELRTPLASLRANIQTLSEAHRLPAQEQDDLRRDIVDELDELTALVADVVELARGADPDVGAEDVRLDELVLAAVRSARRRGDVNFELRLQPAIVHGSPERIARAVSNVIDNARKWSPPDGAVEVALTDGALTVRDHGPGFDQRDLPHVFDRFYRAQAARGMPGSGLGLAIVRQAAEACGGYARAENAAGGGALLSVSFGPSTPPADVG